ncbi:glycosyltransferase family 4 protein [Iamia majanohamensis]|uniref:Glycosyltransferase family 4 protein n=1 Tax=Iamia majanohamensis TaxID=467976 RepID=A0AAE9Y454_9ACTN|nr:glycosyltransferase family 4 protein [Iamia majanohamensis]WCO65817.1 glycosyltransferase family 4 protein [Iamia majanohamensis]
MSAVAPLRPGLRIGVLKPEVGVTGGFERVVGRVEAALRADGHEVVRTSVDLNAVPHRPFGVEVPDAAWAAAPEYFRHLAGVEAFEAVGTSHLDAVISTQPPSFATPHPHHLSLFFHHHRVYYDLEDVFIEAGYAADPELHRRAAARVRALDQPRLDAVTWFAAGSETVRRRLGRFNGIDRVSLFHAGRAVGAEVDAPPPDAPRRGPVLCVGRFEFPKRPELFVAALRRLPQVPATLVGVGGRTAWVRAVDHRLARTGTDLDAVDERALWCCTGQDVTDPAPEGWASNIALAGSVDDATLTHLYATAPCVVAPALDEDYGLTAVEAMAHGAPVVVCEDGGGLADLVDHEVDGLVVPPTGAALAGAVERILTDPDLAATLSAGARARAAGVTWARAEDEVRLALAIALDAAEPATAVG